MSEFAYQVGDSFEGGPIELQKYIHEILSVGGEFEYAGNLVTLTHLPDSVETVDEVAANTVAALETSEPVAEPVSEPVVETPVEEEIVVAPAPVVDVEDEVIFTPEPVPTRRGRKPKAQVEKAPTVGE